MKQLLILLTLLILLSCKSNFEKGIDAFNNNNMNEAYNFFIKASTFEKYKDSSKLMIEKINKYNDSIMNYNDSVTYITAINLYKQKKYDSTQLYLNTVDLSKIHKSIYIDSIKILNFKVDSIKEFKKRIIAEKKRKEIEKIRIETIITKLDNNINELKKYKYKHCETINDINFNLLLLATYQQIIEDTKNEKDLNIKKKLKTFKYLVIKNRKTILPKLRKDYANILDAKLWEYNVDVISFGKNYKYLELVSGMFANNKNIKTTQTSLADMAGNLRFSQIRYKWYKGAQEYTYYNLHSPKDYESYILY